MIEPSIHVERLFTDSAPQISAFFDACHAADPTLRPLPVNDFLDWTTRVRPHLAGVRRDGDLVGYAYATHAQSGQDRRRLVHFRIIVLPRVRNSGIGSALLDWVVDIAQDGGRPGLQCSCLGAWTAGRAFLEARGFVAYTQDLEMVRDPSPVPDPESPAGIEIRPIEAERDVTGWVRVHREAYALSPLYVDLDAEVARYHCARRDNSVIVATDGGEVVGFCQTIRATRDDPHVESLAVHPSHQRRGIARALLRTALGSADAHASPVSLTVAAEGPAVLLYRSEGFRETAHDIVYRRDL